MNRKQFVIDTATMLLEQGDYAWIPAKAANPGVCVYRTVDGKKCAVGVHIPDDVYDAGMENTSVDFQLAAHAPIKQAIEAKYGKVSAAADDQHFIREVQWTLHDKRARAALPMLTVEQAIEKFAYSFEK